MRRVQLHHAKFPASEPLRLKIARRARIAAAKSTISRSLGSGTLCGCPLERKLPVATDALASAGGCARGTVGSGKLELAGACAKVVTDAMLLVDGSWVTSEAEDAVVPVLEALVGSFEALDDPWTTDPTERSDSAARGFVKSNEADVGLLDVA